MTGHDLVRMVFELDSNAWHGTGRERLWVEPVGRARFRLRNTPFHAFGVSAEDIVIGEHRGGELFYSRVSIRGGHSSYRLRLSQSNNQFSSYWAPLERLGCSYEEGPTIGVDVPPRADIYEVYALLEAGEAADAWDFEEGHCGHPLRDQVTKDST